MSWTPERIDELTRLWKEGYSASQIASTLGGVSRNAVIGKLHRLGLSERRRKSDGGLLGERPAVKASDPSPEPQPAPPPRSEGLGIIPTTSPSIGSPRRALTQTFVLRNSTRAQRLAEAKQVRADYEAAKPAPAEVVPINGVPFLDRRHGQCAQLITEPDAQAVLCCGKPIERDGSPYCRAHAARNYHRPQDRNNRNAWDSTRIEQLRAIRDSGKTQRQAANAMRISQSTIETASRKYLGGWKRDVA